MSNVLRGAIVVEAHERGYSPTENRNGDQIPWENFADAVVTRLRNG